jgi:chromosome partitioning protein
MSGQAWRVAVIAGKGGVGKTTTVINLGAGLAALGRRVLLVDCDPQGNLTSGLGLDPYARRRTIADVIVGRCASVDAILETDTPGLHLIPAHPDLSAVESELPARVNAELRLRNALREGLDTRYDVVLFDTPPNFGFHTISALGAARSALVPLQMSAFALRGLKEVIRVIAAARRHLNPELELLGVAPTFVNNTRFSRDMLEALSDVSQVRVFRSEIGLTVKLQESALQGVPVMVSAPSSSASRAYAALAREVVEVAGGRLRPARKAAASRIADEVPAPAPVDEPARQRAEAAVPDEGDEPVMEMQAVEVDEAPEVHETEDDDVEELDSGYAVTLSGEPTQGAVPLSSAADAVRHLEGRRVRKRVTLEVSDGQGGIAIAQLPPVDLDAVEDDAPNGHAEVEDEDDAEPAAVAPEAETRHRRRFLFFGRKAS